MLRTFYFSTAAIEIAAEWIFGTPRWDPHPAVRITSSFCAAAALLFGFLEPVEKVGVVFLQTGHLSRVDPEEWTSDTRFSELGATAPRCDHR